MKISNFRITKIQVSIYVSHVHQNFKDCLKAVQNNAISFFSLYQDECLVVELFDIAEIQ